MITAHLSTLELPARYGTVLAYVKHFPRERRTEVLRRLELDTSEFTRIADATSDAIVSDMERGRDTAAETLSTAYRATKERLAKESPELEQVGRPSAATCPSLAPSATHAPVTVAASAAHPEPAPVQSAAPIMAAPAPLSPSHPRLSMHQYASLRAEVMTAAEEEHGAVYARYGLDANSDVAEVAAWTTQFNADPALFRTYLRVFQYFRGIAMTAR